DLYRKAFIDLDEKALAGPGMTKAFAQFRKMIDWADPGIPGRDWDVAASMMLKGEAAFFFMGDWAIGYYNATHYKAGTDYLCGGAPMDNGKPGFILNSDSIVFFKQTDPDYVEGQRLLANIVMSKDFQKIFNIAKGSIPARMDVDLTDFTSCQQQS